MSDQALPAELRQSEVVETVRKTAQEIGLSHENQLLSAVAMWLLREAELATLRAYELAATGVPEDTAWFVAIDDMGFQLAYGAAQGWGGK